MFTPTVHIQLTRLWYINERLLKMYSSILEHEENNKEMIKKIQHRIALRTKIGVELEQLKGTLFSKKEKGHYKILLSVLLLISRTEELVIRSFRRRSRSRLRTLEYQNIKVYYKLLFLQSLSPAVIDLLLAQKRELENKSLPAVY